MRTIIVDLTSPAFIIRADAMRTAARALAQEKREESPRPDEEQRASKMQIRAGCQYSIGQLEMVDRFHNGSIHRLFQEKN